MLEIYIQSQKSYGKYNVQCDDGTKKRLKLEIYKDLHMFTMVVIYDKPCNLRHV